MSLNALIPVPASAPKPKNRLRGLLYASALLIGGGVIGAIVVGPTLGQQGPGPGPSAQQDQGPQGGQGPDGPRWRQGRGGDDQAQDEDGRGSRRGWGRDRQAQGDEERHGWGRDRQARGDEERGGWGRDRQARGDEERGGWRRFRQERMGQSDGDDQGMRGGGFAGRMMYPGAIERRVNRVLGAVDASTEQRQKVRAIFEAAANDMFPMRQQRMDNRKQMREALGAATIDRARIEALRTDQMKFADARSKRMTTALADAAEVLTPAQRADLASRFQRRRGG